MANIKLVVEYDGTGYCGFQRQSRLPTIQGELEAALGKLLDEPVAITAAGRTDAGVHALGQVVNFRSERPVPAARWPRAVNRLLPRQIVVKRAQEVGDDFHARRMATSRRYQYTILNRGEPSALLGRFAYQTGDTLDLAAMRGAARPLVGEHDFAAFQAAGSPSASTVRRVTAARVMRLGDVVIVVIEANSFLYQMARIAVAALLAVGRGELAPADVQRIMKSGDRGRIGPPAPPHGLCLVRVRY
ncbi:MAG: tRNA pseudouridine(38-40) synthase TruA [Armatimonadota bacterium]|nr:MAG: tRNA pseudouridine(38-40) synthase TruA [Armatimonadota bacterium]